MELRFWRSVIEFLGLESESGVGNNMQINIVNLQRKVGLKTSSFSEFSAVLSAKAAEVKGQSFVTAFISDRRMRELNKFFRGIDSTTDVLSFPHETDEFEAVYSRKMIAAGDGPAEAGSQNFLGDIVISVEQAARQAEENGLTLENEIKQLMLHGVLHLCGYDHETDNGEMNAREMQLREELAI